MHTISGDVNSNRFEWDGRVFIRAASVVELEQRPFKVVTLEDRHILLLRADGQIRALDSRCPHMGYPLSQGTIKDGVLRCHWHHWRFDLASGGCFTEGGDDVAVFPLVLRDGEVWVSPVPLDGYTRRRAEKFLGDLRQGMEERNTFLIAKAVAGLRSNGVPDRDILSAGAMHGLRFRQGGFSMGLTILTCMGRLVPDLQEDDKALADVHALLNCARDSFGGPPRRLLRPLPTTEFTNKTQLKQWFRLFIEDREAAGAERILRTAIVARYSTEDLIEMLVAGATDHYFLSTGHVIDFTNKAFELFEIMTANGALPSSLLPRGISPSASTLLTPLILSLSSILPKPNGSGISFAKESFCERMPQVASIGVYHLLLNFMQYGWATVRRHAGRVECGPMVPQLRCADRRQRSARSRHRSRLFQRGGTPHECALPPLILGPPAGPGRRETDHQCLHTSHPSENRRKAGA
jgi:nitrite reductase/ring-hydroxylating ferredoxin subunit